MRQARSGGRALGARVHATVRPTREVGVADTRTDAAIAPIEVTLGVVVGIVTVAVPDVHDHALALGVVGTRRRARRGGIRGAVGGSIRVLAVVPVNATAIVIPIIVVRRVVPTCAPATVASVVTAVGIIQNIVAITVLMVVGIPAAFGVARDCYGTRSRATVRRNIGVLTIVPVPQLTAGVAGTVDAGASTTVPAVEFTTDIVVHLVAEAVLEVRQVPDTVRVWQHCGSRGGTHGRARCRPAILSRVRVDTEKSSPSFTALVVVGVDARTFATIPAVEAAVGAVIGEITDSVANQFAVSRAVGVEGVERGGRVVIFLSKATKYAIASESYPSDRHETVRLDHGSALRGEGGGGLTSPVDPPSATDATCQASSASERRVS